MKEHNSPRSPADAVALVAQALSCGLVEKTKTYALHCHSSTNHLYDGQLHALHLQMVYDYACKYCFLLPDVPAISWALASAWSHGGIEDCRQTYNDVKAVCGLEVAEITYALTNEKGSARKGRANEAYYEGIRNTPYAGCVKICDRLANVKYSKDNGGRVTGTYQNEGRPLKDALAGIGFRPMWEELSGLLASRTN